MGTLYIRETPGGPFVEADFETTISLGPAVADLTFGSAKVDGVATTAAHSDHTHGNPVHNAAAHATIPFSSLAAATGNVAMGGFRITNHSAPVVGTDVANKDYVDAIAASKWKTVRVASTGNINVALGGALTIDGVATAAGNRVLLKDQTSGFLNGIYVVNTGPWTRATDADSGSEIEGMAVFVTEGTANGDKAWVCTTNAPITPGTTNLTFVQLGGGTGGGTYTAGAGLTLVGSTFDVVPANGSLTVAADSVAVAYGGTGAAVTAARSDHNHDASYSAISHTHTAATVTFTPTGTIAATNVQAAIAEVAAEATGGGGGITTEDAVDAVATALVAGNNVDITYNDAANTITVDVEALTKSDVGLGNVDNTSDANKPVSTAQAAADALKADKTTTIATTAPLAGGGDLSTGRTLTVAQFSTSTTTSGVVPGSSGAGATSYLNGTGAWSVPASGGTYTAGTGLALTGTEFNVTAADASIVVAADTIRAGYAGTGSAVTLARSDHDHDTTYVNVAGDTMTGALVLADDPADALGAATKQYVDATGGGGTGTVQPFTFNATPTAPPTGNQLRFNNATQTAVTLLWISQTTFDGLDVTVGLSRIKANYQIYIQDFDDSSKSILFNVTGSGTDMGSYWEIPVAYSSGPANIPAQKVALQTILPSSHGIPPGGADDQVLTKTSSADYAVAWETPTGGGITQAAADTRYVNVTGTETMAGPLTVGTSSNGAYIDPSGYIARLGGSNLIELTAGSGGSLTLMENTGIPQAVIHATNTSAPYVDLTGTTPQYRLNGVSLMTLVGPLRRTVSANTSTTVAVTSSHENIMTTLSNASAITVTLPSNATSAVTIGAECDFLWLGVGQPTFAAGSGATVNGTPGLKLRAQYSACTAKKIATNDWVVIGDLSA